MVGLKSRGQSKETFYNYSMEDIKTERHKTNTELLVTESDSPPMTGTVLVYAQAGDANLQNQMGLMCYHGDCMPEDKEQAVEWWKLAAAQGHAEAQNALDVYATPPQAK